MYLGIDLSHHNGNVDMKKVKAAGYEYAILRAGFGKNNADSKYERNATQCQDANVPFGIYWFSYAYTVEMARQEAKYAIAILKKYQNNGVIAYDLEYDSVNYAKKQGVIITKSLATEMAKVFIAEVKSAGFTPILYTNDDYEKNYFNMDQFDCYIWYARYKSCISTTEKNHAAIWQKSSSGIVNGITGDVDINEIYVELRNESASNSVIEVEEKVNYSPGTYKLTCDLKIRAGAGTNYRQKTYSQLTTNAKIHATKEGVLKTGTKVDVSKITIKGSEVWGLIPSGWIALLYENESIAVKC